MGGLPFTSSALSAPPARRDVVFRALKQRGSGGALLEVLVGVTRERVAFWWASQKSSGRRAGHLPEHLGTARLLRVPGPGQSLLTRTHSPESQLIAVVLSVVSSSGDPVKAPHFSVFVDTMKGCKEGSDSIRGMIGC